MTFERRNSAGSVRNMGVMENSDYVYDITADFLIEVAKGNVPGHALVEKFGENLDVDIGAVPEDLWAVGDVWVPPTQARIHDIASSSANDAAAGTGARTILVEGLDENWAQVSETITLNGTTDVETTNTYNAIHTMTVLTAGSSETNAGNISATAQTDSTITTRMPTGNGRTQLGVFTIPAGKTGYVLSYHGSVTRNSPSNATARINLAQRTDRSGSNTAVIFRHALDIQIAANNPYRQQLYGAISIPEKNDVFLRISSISDDNTGVRGGFTLLLVDDE